ncbi:PxORF6 peptide [Plutella xylostella granulovirus]|uniref:ORF6 protein n=1 Tax=Plutella xylostella granulovirus TaxID=98383 RepID=Q9JGU4_9BBAC|nr:PxORF6 peptide [Plutella xylostella granulovirus]AAG27304.1 PxORF6 peptide [Plutella xylostella granulovirus]AMQ35618.1 PxGV-Corf6 protein [Plutella xylostella granulovirus]AMQ35735.1 PxGV-Korf6 protein [Plutella xylostella granulovirus]AMQ35852.1 PxGV-Morf6 protein [Plutella xylostella granulovirus]AMQ35969.1 PxGV-Torf6 protein [Plutella xylostella granulovirus]
MKSNKSISQCVEYLKNLEVVGKLNDGEDTSYENIYLIKKKDSNQVYVQKIVNKKIFTFLELYVHEIMKHNSHFVTLHNVVHLPDTTFWTMDFIKDGDLFEIVKNDIYKITEKQCKKLMLQLVNAIHELHKHQIIHNDIKLENLLYNREKQKIYICDYGLVHIMNTPSTHDGTNVYFSPEKIKGEPYQAAFDWWAVGVVTYEILTGKYPYVVDGDEDNCNDIEPEELLKHLSKSIPKIRNVSPAANDFVQSMLRFDMSKRLCTYNDIIRHPFLNV